ncbi:MAG: RNA-binding transcriptional accessory protein [Verrucomicrobiales bacterium]|nr:RNA-binding transcriptional accessory protein [Verrucomicrobiales bacterium]
MNERFVARIAAELHVPETKVSATARLLADGATVPFIARYRKEATGSLDEVAITAVRDRMTQLVELEQRREAILKSLSERNLLTDTLKGAVDAADTLSALEDVYAPYRPKRRTRATIAREAGLEPLADQIFANQETLDPAAAAALFVNPEKQVADVAAALSGARDILAERVSEDALARSRLRELYWKAGTVRSKVVLGKETEGAKFKDYFDWTEPVDKIPSHRLLAIRRGEEEGILLVRVTPPEDDAIALLEPMFVKAPGTPAGEQVRLAVVDGYKRLLGFAIEGEVRLGAKQRADTTAIRVFADNLRELLLAPALGQKTVLAIDPGFRTGCKTVVLDRQGKLLHHDVIYPTAAGPAQIREAAETVQALVRKYTVEAVAIGNGTASRETEQFVRALKLPASIPVVLVNESGASIYSASEVAREEFPNEDVTVRGAVSIGRRLMDPLAELVKLDPKSIGVGQYQHDVDETALKQGLDDTVVSCVNRVGVELNTASKQLLSYVSGLGPSLAANIVSYRNENGPFRSRKELLKVPRLGPKAFEQCAGFLRVRDGEHPLDGSAVHPERYDLVDAIARDLRCRIQDLLHDAALRSKIQPEKYVTDSVGLPTLQDILSELARPGRDPRQQFEVFAFQEGVEKMEDLKPGMRLPGIVTNVTAFGAFVDVGVHQDGLVHVSQLADRFVKDPAEVVKVGQKVRVTVTEVDLERKRIALSMRANPQIGAAKESRTSPAGPRSPGSPARPAPKPQARFNPAEYSWNALADAFDKARSKGSG